MWLKQDPEQARLAIDAAEANRAGKIKTSTGAYIRKLIEDGATLGQSGYAAEKAARSRPPRTRRCWTSCAAVQHRCAQGVHCRHHARPHAGPGARILRGLTSEQQGTAGPLARSGKFSNSATNVNFRHTWLPSASRPALTRPDSTPTCATRATTPRPCVRRPRCCHRRNKPHDSSSPPGWHQLY
jgi:hypothetical protein